MLSDLDAIDDALANAGARNANKFRPKVGKLLEKKVGKPFAAVQHVDTRVPKESPSVPQADSQLPTSRVDATHGLVTNDAGTEELSNAKENPFIASSGDVCYDLDRIGVIHTDSANDVCDVRSDTYSNQVGKAGRNPTMFDSNMYLNDPNDVLADSLSTGSLLDNQGGQSATPLQQDKLISNACDALEEPPFSSCPFSLNAYDTNLEMGEADAPDQAVGSGMNDELLGDVDKVERFHVPGLDDETSRETRSLRKTRKRKSTLLSHVDGKSAKSKDELSEIAEEASDSADVDESGSDEDFSEGNTIKRKRMAKGRMKLPEEPKPKNQSKSRQKTQANEGPTSSKKEPKKKFSHSTRRTRKLMDETLLETPEGEINPRTLILKDLILLAEMKEKKLNKAAATAVGSSVSPERDAAAFQEGVAADGKSQCCSPSPNGDGDEINQTDEPTRPKLNYHSYMKRTPSQRWSDADTELFYKALQQFGTDFEMIQKLFPGRTRHQVKLKYKKEERKHPLQLADALVNRSKDHTHFQLVIDQLQSQAESISCKSTGSPDIDGQKEEADNHFEDYDNLGSHETRDIDEWSHEVFDNASSDYVGKDDYSDYYQ